MFFSHFYLHASMCPLLRRLSLVFSRCISMTLSTEAMRRGRRDSIFRAAEDLDPVFACPHHPAALFVNEVSSDPPYLKAQGRQQQAGALDWSPGGLFSCCGDQQTERANSRRLTIPPKCKATTAAKRPWSRKSRSTTSPGERRRFPVERLSSESISNTRQRSRATISIMLLFYGDTLVHVAATNTAPTQHP